MAASPSRFAILLGGALLVLAPPCAAADQSSAPGRDFPKTLIFDEPGIDDEISLPTLLVLPAAAQPGREVDLAFELDKRLTTWLSIQINEGYAARPRPGGTGSGWEDTAATLKFIVLDDKPMERLVSISLTRELGGSGAARVGAAPVGSTGAAVNFGQGFAPLAGADLLKPLAITGSAGYFVPDSSRGSAEQAVLSASLQYSLDVLADTPAGSLLPASLRPLIPIVECVLSRPTGNDVKSTATLAPGLIYAGHGFQLAAEMLIPLTAASGRHIGVIAQLNISLSVLHIPALAEPVFR